MKRKYNKTRGFTLIELLIVMAIIGMMAALVGPTLFDKFFRAQRDAAKAQITSLGGALDQHRMDTFKYPQSLEGLIKNTTGKSTWQGPYLRKEGIPKDPWGNDYQYKYPGTNGHDYDLFSFGADGKQGGEGDDADVVSWE